jgi:asparagine synthase (glutamine-hydrolysing)
MTRLSFLTVLPSWFVVLPDDDSARSVAATLHGHAAKQLSHASGRPWLLGCWDDGAVATGQAGGIRIAVIGQHAVTTDELTRAAGQVRVVSHLDRLAGSLVGSSHLLASVDGQVRLQGTLTGTRRVFHATVDGARVAADRADVLAGLLDAGVDERRLALQLLEPHVLYPIAGHPVWHGVEELRTDHYLVLERDRYRSVRWWTPPEPAVPMAEGAQGLRDALSAAVAARVRGKELVTCDLGGLDSTSVCCLAAHQDAKVVAYTAASLDPLADDVMWAGRTVAGLDNLEHHIIAAEEMPLVYHGLALEDQLDEPCAATVDRDRWLIIARRAAARGSRMHLTGMGGDELLYGSLAHLHSMLRTTPRIALRHLRGFAAKYRWPWRQAWRQLTDPRTYPAWLASVADTLTAPPPSLNEPLLDWGFRPRLPRWASPAAVQAVQDQIRTEAATVEPLAEGRGQHRELEAMRFVSRISRQFDQMAGRIGVPLATPYHDDRVIEAGLAVRPQERITPWRYKPLILEAMAGIVPDESLARQTKANGSCDADPGLRRHRDELLALWEDSRLAQLGLINAEALRETCMRPLPPELQFGGLDQTVACEAWLRSLERATLPG